MTSSAPAVVVLLSLQQNTNVVAWIKMNIPKSILFMQKGE
jgi:hypothetical protein